MNNLQTNFSKLLQEMQKINANLNSMSQRVKSLEDKTEDVEKIKTKYL